MSPTTRPMRSSVEADRPRTRAEQQARTRRRLLDAARDVIIEHGADGATIDAIASRAGFTRGAFYSNFEDKTDLLVQLGETELQRFTDEVLPGVLALPAEAQLDAVAGWFTRREAPTEVLLLVELARSRTRASGAHDAVDAVVAQLLRGIEQLMSAPGSALAGLDATERRSRSQAVLAAVLGADLLSHLGVELDEPGVRSLLAGAITPPEGAA